MLRQPKLLMKKNIIVLLSFVTLFGTVGWLIRFDPEPITDQEVENLRTALNTVFQSRSQNQNQASSSNLESIMAIIYRKPDATWFIKARGKTDLVNQQAVEFSKLFLDEMQFEKNQPVFSHIPDDYLSGSGESMRVATFNLNGLEVSVTKLGPNQDVQANILRWRRQLNLPDNTPEFVKFQDNNNTVLVRLNQPELAQSQPQAPQKENLEDFTELNLDASWKKLESSSGMASANLQTTIDNQIHQVAVLRLPSSVPVETILGIWKERVGIEPEQSIPAKQVITQWHQEWTLFTIKNNQNHILIAMLKGKNRYTFLRFSGPAQLSPVAIGKFEKLLDQIKVTKN